MSESIPVDASDLTGQIEAAVSEALAVCSRSHAWRRYTGKHQADLVAALQELSACEHVGLASSGTAALEMLLAACRLRPGGEVLLSAYDYPGTFAAIERLGARPALVDIAEQSWALSWQSLQQAWTPACRVLIVSHLHGQIQPMAQLERWCHEHDVWLIQDACQALGAVVDGMPIGFHGDATIYSFGGGKTISAGRGGAWATRNSQLAQHARLAAGVGSGSHEMSELQAAVVLAQLPYLDAITKRCRAYFAQLHTDLATQASGLIAPWIATVNESAFYQAGWLVPLEKIAQAGTADVTSNARIDAVDDLPFDAGSQALQKRSSGEPSSSVSKLPPINSPLMIGLSQSQHADWQRIGIGSGFQGYHRRSTRRCRIQTPLENTARNAQRTVTVHHRAAMLAAPVAEALAHVVLGSTSGNAQ